MALVQDGGRLCQLNIISTLPQNKICGTRITQLTPSWRRKLIASQYLTDWCSSTITWIPNRCNLTWMGSEKGSCSPPPWEKRSREKFKQKIPGDKPWWNVWGEATTWWSQYISLYLFFPLSGVRWCLQLFTASSASLFHPTLSCVFFFQSPSSPAFFTSLFTQSSHLSLGLPRLLLPCSRNSAALFGNRSSAILSTCPAHCNLLLASLSVKLLCTPVSSLNSTILRLSALVTLAIFRTQLFSHTCSLCCCSSVSAKDSVPYRQAGVTQVRMTLPFSLFEIRRSAITPSTDLHAFAPACALRRTSLFVFPSPHTAPPRYTKLPRCVSFSPSSSMSSSSLWWPMCSTSVWPITLYWALGTLRLDQVTCRWHEGAEVGYL